MSRNERSLRIVQPNKADDYLTGENLSAAITNAGHLVVRTGKAMLMRAYPPGQWLSVHACPDNAKKEA